MQETDYDILIDQMNVNKYLLFIKIQLHFSVFLKETDSHKIELFIPNMWNLKALPVKLQDLVPQLKEFTLIFLIAMATVSLLFNDDIEEG